MCETHGINWANIINRIGNNNTMKALVLLRLKCIYYIVMKYWFCLLLFSWSGRVGEKLFEGEKG